jgi:hypothetical protein
MEQQRLAATRSRQRLEQPCSNESRSRRCLECPARRSLQIVRATPRGVAGTGIGIGIGIDARAETDTGRHEDCAKLSSTNSQGNTRRALAMDRSDWNETPRGRAPGLIASNDAWLNRSAPVTEPTAQPKASVRSAPALPTDPWSASAAGLVAADNVVRPAPAVPAAPFDASSHWSFAVSPYVWLPRVSGSMRFTGPGTADGFGSRSVDASTGPYNYLQDLKFASMIQGEARKGDWSVFADTVLLSFGKRGASVNNAASGTAPGVQRSAETAMRGAMVELGGGFTVLRRPRAIVDVIGGLRYLGAKGTFDARFDVPGGGTRGAHTSQSADIVNGFAGVRGRIAMTQDGRWYVPFYLDAGTGSSKVTWQAMTGVGYVLNNHRLKSVGLYCGLKVRIRVA